MPDYTEQNLAPLDPLHHVEGLVSLSDRVARRKQEQQRRRQKQRQYEEDQTDADTPSTPPPEAAGEDDGHIDFCA